MVWRASEAVPRGASTAPTRWAKGRSCACAPLKALPMRYESLLEMGIDHLHFCDSEFNLPEDHARDICLELVRRGTGG